MKISRRDNLDRYYLLQFFGRGLFLHHIHHDETKATFHSHPWPWWSLIFGRYREERLAVIAGKPSVVSLERRWFNHLRPKTPDGAKVYHRVELPHGPVWTLCLHSRRCNRWEVVDGEGRVLDTEPWRGVGGRTAYRPPGV